MAEIYNRKSHVAAVCGNLVKFYILDDAGRYRLRAQRWCRHRGDALQAAATWEE